MTIRNNRAEISLALGEAVYTSCKKAMKYREKISPRR